MTKQSIQSDPSTWDPALDAVVAAPRHHKVLFENENLRVLEVCGGGLTDAGLAHLTGQSGRPRPGRGRGCVRALH